jgi:DNA-binding transcriptional LysR family regulator
MKKDPLPPLVNNVLVKYPDLNVELHLTILKLGFMDEGYDLAIRLGKLSNSTMMAKRLSSHTLTSAHHRLTFQHYAFHIRYLNWIVIIVCKAHLIIGIFKNEEKSATYA